MPHGFSETHLWCSFLVDRGSIRGASGVDQGMIGVDWRSIRGRSGIDQGSFRGRFGVDGGSIRGRWRRSTCDLPRINP